jgi:hypothetical protein
MLICGCEFIRNGIGDKFCSDEVKQMLTLWKNKNGFALLGDLLIIVVLVVVASVAISAIGALH